MSDQPLSDRRAAVLRKLRRALATAPPVSLSPNALSFNIGINAEQVLLLQIIADHDDLSDPLLSRQSSIIRATVVDLANDLMTNGRRTKFELAYPDDAVGGAQLLRDEVLAALGSRARMLGPDPQI